MSLRCYFGFCTRSSNDLTTGLPAPIVEFESWILRNKIGRTLQELTADRSYHAYLTMTAMPAESDLATVWGEFARHPAPQFFPDSRDSRRRANPVQTGEESVVYYGVLLGGRVEHVVRPDIYALANVTRRPHVLYPGYIIRWLGQPPGGGAVVSYTLGRGVGLFARTNENKGAEMFMALDNDIIESLAR